MNYQTRDMTFCASPNCENKCGRKMSDEMRRVIISDSCGRTSFAYFCGEREEGKPVDWEDIKKVLRCESHG